MSKEGLLATMRLEKCCLFLVACSIQLFAWIFGFQANLCLKAFGSVGWPGSLGDSAVEETKAPTRGR